MEEINYTYSSRKNYALVRKLGVAHSTRKVGCVAANDIANLLFKMSNNEPHKCQK